LIPGWLDAAFAERMRVRERVEELDAGDGSAYDELKSPMWPWCALVQTPAWTGAPVEARYPFLDLRLVSFVLSVPSVPWAHDKELVRAAMRGRLPDEVLTREKAPLSEDPVRVLFRRDGPPRIPDASSPVWEFVDRARFERALHADPAGKGWRRDVTRVISLDGWMRTV
jgi:asparagine synthase (glutamine-hydrolysing)